MCLGSQRWSKQTITGQDCLLKAEGVSRQIQIVCVWPKTFHRTICSAIAAQVSSHMFATLVKAACRLCNACQHTCLVLTITFLVDYSAQKEQHVRHFVDMCCDNKLNSAGKIQSNNQVAISGTPLPRSTSKLSIIRQHDRVNTVSGTMFPLPDMTEAGAEQHVCIYTMIREIQQEFVPGRKTSTGEWQSFSKPVPRRPKLPRPHPKMRPSAVSTIVCVPPQDA